MKINFSKLIEDSRKLTKKITKKYDAVFGVPTGGLIPGLIVSQEFEIPLLTFSEFQEFQGNVLIVDDLIDSGRTLSSFSGDKAVLYKKENSPDVDYFVEEVSGWVNLPHDRGNNGIEENIIRILEFIGENPNRQGLKGTPDRVARMYKEIFRGYDINQRPKITVFDNNTDGVAYDQMIIDTGYFYSNCEHHMVPFFGRYWLAYIPDKKVVGLSKIARLIDWYSAKLQIQERLTKEIVDDLQKTLEPKGIMLIMEGRHLCKEMRGVKKYNSTMKTSEIRGVFNNLETRQEFLNLIK